MALFALACEGITDQIVIENILCGFYNQHDDLDEDIQPLQPPYDVTTQKQQEGEFGGWEMLFAYLSEKRFRDDVLNNNYVIIQVDTDVSERTNFDIPYQNNRSTTELIEQVIKRLILQIDSKKAFYKQYQEKIIFAISIHSLECWLLPLYRKANNEKISGCFNALKRAVKKMSVGKNYRCYNMLSNPFLKRKKLMAIVDKNSSLNVFIASLPNEI